MLEPDEKYTDIGKLLNKEKPPLMWGKILSGIKSGSYLSH
jgi:hypothetical protein